ncbi:ammonium transporter, partial [Streptococcus suis]
MIGIFADKAVYGVSASWHQFWIQVFGVILVAIYSFVITLIILKILGAITNIEPSDEEIANGLDASL